MNKRKLLKELSVKLGNNRGLAERAFDLFERYGLADIIKDNAEQLSEIEDAEELRDWLSDIAYSMEIGDKGCHLGFFIDLLMALNYEYDRNCGRGHLADLMVIYYNNR